MDVLLRSSSSKDLVNNRLIETQRPAMPTEKCVFLDVLSIYHFKRNYLIIFISHFLQSSQLVCIDWEAWKCTRKSLIVGLIKKLQDLL